MSQIIYRPCPVPNCTRTVPPDKFCCTDHWFQIPKVHRHAVNAAYRAYLRDRSKETITILRAVQSDALRALKESSSRSNETLINPKP